MSAEPQQLLAGGKIASSISPAFHLIPSVAITALANRCKLGVERKADKAWNATTNNQECLTDRELILHRIGHVIDHAWKLRDKLIHADAENDIEALNTDDDAAAVMWGGMFLVCAIDAVRDEMEGIDAKARAATQGKPSGPEEFTMFQSRDGLFRIHRRSLDVVSGAGTKGGVEETLARLKSEPEFSKSVTWYQQ